MLSSLVVLRKIAAIIFPVLSRELKVNYRLTVLHFTVQEEIHLSGNAVQKEALTNVLVNHTSCAALSKIL